LLLLQVYGGDLDKVDVMVGLLAEPQLPGFIFGEGIYSIFTLQVWLPLRHLLQSLITTSTV
jgi:hypothetical protein